MPNETKLATLVPGRGSLAQKARRLIAAGAGTVIVTLGERGCRIVTHDTDQAFPAADFTPVDNTGAGDAFISALASYLMYGHDLEEAIRIGMVAAGYSTTRAGVVEALIDRSTLEARLAGLRL